MKYDSVPLNQSRQQRNSGGSVLRISASHPGSHLFSWHILIGNSVLEVEESDVEICFLLAAKVTHDGSHPAWCRIRCSFI